MYVLLITHKSRSVWFGLILYGYEYKACTSHQQKKRETSANKLDDAPRAIQLQTRWTTDNLGTAGHENKLAPHYAYIFFCIVHNVVSISHALNTKIQIKVRGMFGVVRQV